jgi:hypothetical protein
MKYIFFTFLAFLVISCQNPQLFEDEPPYIAGRVFNSENDQPIPGATVSTEPPTQQVTTDNNGQYKIPNVKPGTYKVIAKKDGFLPGTINVTVGDKPIFADIRLNPLKPILYISTNSLDFGSDQIEKLVTMRNIGSGTLEWSIHKTASWLDINPMSGSLTSGAYTVITFKVSRNNLAPGTYSTQVKMTTTGGDTDITVQMSVPNPAQPQLYVSPKVIEFKVGENAKKITLKNTGNAGSIKWNATPSSNWMILSKSSGEFSSEDSITIFVNRAGLSDGVYQGSIKISSNAGSDSVQITLYVQNENPVFDVYPTYIDFGTSKSEDIITLLNIGTGGTINWNAYTDASWLTLSRSSGQFKNRDTIKIKADRSQIPQNQTKTGNIYFASNAGNKTVSVSIINKPPENPILFVYPEQLDFDSTKTTMQLVIKNVGTGILTWQITKNQDWTNVSPSSGTGDATVNVSIDRSIISNPGTYTGILTVNSNGGTKQVNVKVITPQRQLPQPPREIVLGQLKITFEKLERKDQNTIYITLSFTNLTETSTGKNLLVSVDKSRTYLTDENSWKWNMTGASFYFDYTPPMGWYWLPINPGARVAVTFYFSPSSGAPNTGTIFRLVMNVLHRFEGESSYSTSIIEFKDLK